MYVSPAICSVFREHKVTEHLFHSIARFNHHTLILKLFFISEVIKTLLHIIISSKILISCLGSSVYTFRESLGWTSSKMINPWLCIASLPHLCPDIMNDSQNLLLLDPDEATEFFWKIALGDAIANIFKLGAWYKSYWNSWMGKKLY